MPTIHPGLTTAEVAARTARGQTNAYRPRVGRTYWDILRDNLFNVFNIVLFTLLAIVLFLGDLGTVFFAGFSITGNTVLSLAQEIYAKRKLDKLAALAATDIPVIRDGTQTHVPLAALVLDDVIPLAPGDRLVVDGELLDADSLEMDESQLTGEMDGIEKSAGDTVLSGSYVLAGSGTMRATRVGADSAINRLSATAKAYKHMLTPIQRRLAVLVELTILLIAVCTPMYFVASFLLTGSAYTLETFRAAVMFIASIVPQGLVLTATVSLSIGAIRMTRYQALVQRINAVEAMANVTVLCFDKTGTLTRNHLQVISLTPLTDSPVEMALMRYLGALSTQNSTAAAIAAYVGNPPDTSAEKRREIAFTSTRKWGAVEFTDGSVLILGAPERVLPPDHPALQIAHDQSAHGMRVLAFASSARLNGDDLPNERRALTLVTLQDEIREDTRATLAEFASQNVRLKVISGDNPETVRYIAEKSGMTIKLAYTGDQLTAMSDSEFESAAWDGDLFARIEPDTKRRLIAALKHRGAFVAMVGDGVNDVPALKEAHLALVMNDGAAISKDVGDIVLLNNAMSTLPRTLAEGRVITQTLYATSKIFLVKCLYSIVFFLLAGFMAMPFPIGAIQVSMMTLFMINIPAALYAFRLIKPAPMQKFRADVLDTVVTAGVIGGVGMTLNYAVIYLASLLDMSAARSSSYVFLTLWGVLILWNTQGIDVLRPATIAPHWKGFLFGISMAALSLTAAHALPTLLIFKPLTPGYWALVIGIVALAAALSSVLTRSHGFVSLLWQLSEAD